MKVHEGLAEAQANFKALVEAANGEILQKERSAKTSTQLLQTRQADVEEQLANVTQQLQELTNMVGQVDSNRQRNEQMFGQMEGRLKQLLDDGQFRKELREIASKEAGNADEAFVMAVAQKAIRQALVGAGATQTQRLNRAALHTYRGRTDAMLQCLHQHGLMPEEPPAPQAPPYHHVRTQWSWARLSGLARLGMVRILERIGAAKSAEACLRHWLQREPGNITLLAALAQRRLAVGDNQGGCRFIERIWAEDGEAEILHQLLFRRGSRPGSRIDSGTETHHRNKRAGCCGPSVSLLNRLTFVSQG
mgnify:CR=1 FL=1